jgi:hypothetical protein
VLTPDDILAFWVGVITTIMLDRYALRPVVDGWRLLTRRRGR